MWHYEYTIEGVPYRFSVESFDACIAQIISARKRSPHLTGTKIFEGGSDELGSGVKHYDQLDPVG
ncbi:MAG: hypothetical protein M3N46_00450 [Actinomycetota bacterium]|nr:hypothetical protein [Actinomycetota bacterium]